MIAGGGPAELGTLGAVVLSAPSRLTGTGSSNFDQVSEVGGPWGRRMRKKLSSSEPTAPRLTLESLHI